MRILLLGKNGQVGWELQRALAPLGQLTALDAGSDANLPADFEDADALAGTVRNLRPDVIVNAAAYTAVDRAENEPGVAARINATAPAALAREAADSGAWLVHYSSDYVFDGSGSDARDENAATGPLNVYGRSKLDGEDAVRASGCRHLILRTSWVYGSRGGNFARTILRRAQDQEQLSVVCDQIGAPTGAELLADATAHAIRMTAAAHSASLAGTYHLVAAGEASWHAYACHVVAAAAAAGLPLKASPRDIAAVPTSAYPTPARRPLNSRLETTKFRATFGLTLPPWQLGVDRMLAETLR